MKHFFIFSAMTSLLLLSSCFDDDEGLFDRDDCIDDLGNVITETRVVDDFNSISLSGIGNILLTQGSPQSLQVRTHENLLPEIETTVSGGELDIDMDFCADDVDQLDFIITIPDITALELTGVGDVVAQNDWDLQNLSVDISGVGSLEAMGTVNQFTITSSGVGTVQAFDLESNICSVNISGTGNAEVFVNDELNVTISGAGNVLYRGNPEITQNITGAGSVVNSN